MQILASGSGSAGNPTDEKPTTRVQELVSRLNEFKRLHFNALSTPRVVWQKIRYIHRNPLRAGWVSEAPDYLYSSARNYTDDENVVLKITPYAGIVFD